MSTLNLDLIAFFDVDEAAQRAVFSLFGRERRFRDDVLYGKTIDSSHSQNRNQFVVVPTAKRSV